MGLFSENTILQTFVELGSDLSCLIPVWIIGTLLSTFIILGTLNYNPHNPIYKFMHDYPKVAFLYAVIAGPFGFFILILNAIFINLDALSD